MRISDWSSDVCSSDLLVGAHLDDVAGGVQAVLADGPAGRARGVQGETLVVVGVVNDMAPLVVGCGRRGHKVADCIAEGGNGTRVDRLEIARAGNQAAGRVVPDLAPPAPRERKSVG